MPDFQDIVNYQPDPDSLKSGADKINSNLASTQNKGSGVLVIDETLPIAKLIAPTPPELFFFNSTPSDVAFARKVIMSFNGVRADLSPIEQARLEVFFSEEGAGTSDKGKSELRLFMTLNDTGSTEVLRIVERGPQTPSNLPSFIFNPQSYPVLDEGATMVLLAPPENPIAKLKLATSETGTTNNDGINFEVNGSTITLKFGTTGSLEIPRSGNGDGKIFFLPRGSGKRDYIGINTSYPVSALSVSNYGDVGEDPVITLQGFYWDGDGPHDVYIDTQAINGTFGRMGWEQLSYPSNYLKSKWYATASTGAAIPNIKIELEEGNLYFSAPGIVREGLRNVAPPEIIPQRVVATSMVIGVDAGLVMEVDLARSTLVGYASGFSLTSGEDNSFFGYATGYLTTTGGKNTAFGSRALVANVTATHNVAIGNEAGYSATGEYNTLIGSGAGYEAIQDFNTHVGYSAGYDNIGDYNVGVGAYALSKYTTYSVALGNSAGRYVDSNSLHNVFIGYKAGAERDVSGNLIFATNSIFIGANTKAQAGSVRPLNSIVIGYGAVSMGPATTVVGNAATTDTYLKGDLHTGAISASGNVAINTDKVTIDAASGDLAIAGALTIDDELLFPYVSNGIRHNLAIGINAGSSLDISSFGNTFLGEDAGKDNQVGDYNTFLGRSAGHFIVTGSRNTRLGCSEPDPYPYGSSLTASTAVGFECIPIARDDNNTAMGALAGENLLTGASNVLIGYQAGQLKAGGADMTTAANCVIIGANAKGPNDGTGDNSIVIGANAVSQGEDTTVIGDVTQTDAYVYGDLHTGDITGGIISGVNLEASGYIYPDGGSIRFPATHIPDADTHGLDDYEEGTFTPSLTFGGGSTGIVYNYQTGNYQKVGNTVHVSGGVFISNKGTSTGAAFITGLPFTITSTLLYHPVTTSFINITNFGQAWVSQSTAAIELSGLNDTNFGSLSLVDFQITYKVA